MSDDSRTTDPREAIEALQALVARRAAIAEHRHQAAVDDLVQAERDMPDGPDKTDRLDILLLQKLAMQDADQTDEAVRLLADLLVVAVRSIVGLEARIRALEEQLL